MQVSVESPSKLQRRITVTVPLEQLDAAYDKRIQQILKTAKIKGYRPGSSKALDRVKELYGNAARQEALSEVIQSSLYDAITQEKLNPVGTPQVEPKSIAPGKPLEYIATFEVLPEIEGVKFAAKTIEKQVSKITKADIDRVLDRLREQHVTWNEVDRGAADKDQVVIDFRGALDGKTFKGGEAHDYPVVIGSKTMIPGFEEGLIGIKKEEEKIINVTFPENYFATELAGKKVEFTINAHKVSAPSLPEMNEELIKKFGIASGNVEELRTEINKNLENELERVTSNKLKSQIFDLLLEQNPMEVPAALIEREAKRIHDEMHPHHAGKEHDHSPQEMTTFNEAAKRNVILGLLIGEVIKQHKLKPDSERVQQHITKMSAAYEKPEEVIKWYQGDKRRLGEIEMMILEEQVLEKLLESVTVNDKMLDYSDLIKG
ncbi:MAG: trigger factor [Pseudomonadota bacterium]